MNYFGKIMTKLIYKLFFCILVFFGSASVLFSQVNKDNSVLPPVEIAGSQLLKMNSAIIGEEYDLYIKLPGDINDTTKSFPVIYVLDGQWDFSLVQAIHGCLYYDGYLPGVIIVSITWGGKNPNIDAKRARDFTPTGVKAVKNSGGGEKFLEFIKKELIPLIDSKYRTKRDDRTLMGSSYAGLFTLYALFNESELFTRYVLTSPSVYWDNGVLYDYEKKFAEKKINNPIKLAMAMGDKEDIRLYQKMVDHLRNRNYENVSISSLILENTGHSGTKAEGYTRGLQFVFERKSIKVDPEILKKYAGLYDFGNGTKIKLLIKNDELLTVDLGGNRIKPFAESDTDFYQKGQFLNIHFQKNFSGGVNGFWLETYSGKVFIKKISD
jgi:predicted alpha/beta superfamily hydrolase